MTPFQIKVLEAAGRIPKGRVATYAEVARAAGSPRAVRAVGTALKHNPYIPGITCHRVVRSDGSLGQYARGAAKKAELLRSEGVDVRGGRVDLDVYSCKL